MFICVIRIYQPHIRRIMVQYSAGHLGWSFSVYGSECFKKCHRKPDAQCNTHAVT